MTCQRETPYYVAVTSGGFSCGGTLIDAQTVLTAAHCVDSAANNRDVLVYTDKTSRFSNSGTPHTGTLTIHPAYNTNNLDNDVAIVVLDSPVTFSETVRPACLNRNPIGTGTDLRISGWGLAETGGQATTSMLTIQVRKEEAVFRQ